MDAKISNIKETDNNKYITHVGSHFSLGSTSHPFFQIADWGVYPGYGFRITFYIPHITE